MNIQTALDEYAWADDSIEACREALQEYSAGYAQNWADPLNVLQSVL